MNHIQRISQRILCDRLKLQMGLDPSLDIDYRTLQDMSRQMETERVQQLAREETSYISAAS